MSNSKVFFTSDLHLFHNNILKFYHQSRQTLDMTEMLKRLLLNWNSKVGKDDTVFILGDILLGKNHVDDVKRYLNLLNGNKVLLYGNHDDQIRENKHDIQSCFVVCLDYLEQEIDGKYFIMGHYPFASWNKQKYGSINLFGHCHGTFKNLQKNQMDVGIDTRNDLNVYSLEEVLEKLK